MRVIVIRFLSILTNRYNNDLFNTNVRIDLLTPILIFNGILYFVYS